MVRRNLTPALSKGEGDLLDFLEILSPLSVELLWRRGFGLGF